MVCTVGILPQRMKLISFLLEVVRWHQLCLQSLLLHQLPNMFKTWSNWWMVWWCLQEHLPCKSSDQSSSAALWSDCCTSVAGRANPKKLSLCTDFTCRLWICSSRCTLWELKNLDQHLQHRQIQWWSTIRLIWGWWRSEAPLGQWEELSFQSMPCVIVNLSCWLVLSWAWASPLCVVPSPGLGTCCPLDDAGWEPVLPLHAVELGKISFTLTPSALCIGL